MAVEVEAFDPSQRGRMRFFLVACLATLCNALAASQTGRISKLSRTVEFVNGLTRVQSTVSARDSLRLAVPASIHGNLSHISAVLKDSKQPVEVARQFHDLETGSIVYDVDLANAQNSDVLLVQVYSHLAAPLPAQLEQKTMDGQYFIWQQDLAGGWSVYNHVEQTTVRVKLPTPMVKTFSTPEAFSSSHPSGSATIVYTSKAALNPGSTHPASVHYFQPEPVVAFKDVHRTIQVSHWSSSVAFEDAIELANTGPKLKGTFSRLTHQLQSYTRRGGPGTPHVLTGLAFALPANSFSPYYTDTVGNVSTSHFRSSSGGKAAKKPALLEIAPRYPLMGGWTYNFTIGYQTPLAQYLKKGAEGEYILALPFLTALRGIPVDAATIKILLPEGAKMTSLTTPFAVDALSEETTYTYLDTTGHPTVVLRKTACSDVHNKDIIITYRYSTAAHLQKPLAATLAFFIVSLTAIGLRRLDWRISK